MAETLQKIPQWYGNFLFFSKWNDCQDHCSLWKWLGFVTCWAVQFWSFRGETTMICCLYPRNDSVMLSASPCHSHSCPIILDLVIKFSASCSVAKSCPALCNQPHELQYTRLLCPPLSPRVYSNSCLLSQWCHPAISSSVIPSSLHLQSFPASGSFPMSQLFISGGQSIGASASVLPMNIQSWFPLGLTGWSTL